MGTDLKALAMTTWYHRGAYQKHHQNTFEFGSRLLDALLERCMPEATGLHLQLGHAYSLLYQTGAMPGATEQYLQSGHDYSMLYQKGVCKEEQNSTCSLVVLLVLMTLYFISEVHTSSNRTVLAVWTWLYLTNRCKPGATELYVQRGHDYSILNKEVYARSDRTVPAVWS